MEWRLKKGVVNAGQCPGFISKGEWACVTWAKGKDMDQVLFCFFGFGLGLFVFWIIIWIRLVCNGFKPKDKLCKFWIFKGNTCKGKTCQVSII